MLFPFRLWRRREGERVKGGGRGEEGKRLIKREEEGSEKRRKVRAQTKQRERERKREKERTEK